MCDLFSLTFILILHIHKITLLMVYRLYSGISANSWPPICTYTKTPLYYTKTPLYNINTFAFIIFVSFCIVLVVIIALCPKVTIHVLNLILIIVQFDCLTGLTKYSLLRWGDGWVGTGWWQAADVCTTSRFPTAAPYINYPSSKPTWCVMRACMFTLQHVDCVGIGMLWAWGLWHRSFSRLALPTHKLFVHVGLD